MINAAIVGLGRWGRSLVSSVQGEGHGLRFTHGQTRTRASASDFAAANKFELVDRYEDLLRDPSIDAIVIATPHSQHEEQVQQALAAGKHVHVEKPLTLDRPSAQRVVEAAERADLVLAVGYCRRFHPSVGDIRRRIADGTLGDVLNMTAQHTTSTGQFIPADNWRADPSEAPAGGLTAVGVHAIDHMIEFAGPVQDVLCHTRRVIDGPSDDTTAIMLRFKGGATGLLFCSVATATNFGFTLYGSRGLAEITGADLGRVRYVPTSDTPPTGAVVPPPDQVTEHRGFNMLGAQLDAFAHSIATGEPYPMPIHDVLHGMAVFDAIVRSAASGRIEPVD